ncbi:hypothetical protein B7494_g747 [Chlorociboria aeruginascens]|nr:hypothetical protein B7494_g747 [Chlorociboria aeruginascens]
MKLTQSLMDAGVSFEPDIDATVKDDVRISREVMNLILGQTHNVKVKPYNDILGARWFASKWISLDVAISGVHALGVREIGPLSLHAIALREPAAENILLRINQLKSLEISIGASMFSRAVEEFARTKHTEFLEGLLKSDQHPDALEDWKLQEALLVSYARAKDWSQYRRTLALRLIGQKSPSIESFNLILRSHITRGNTVAIRATLSKMQLNGIPVKAKSIGHLLYKTLHPRQRGRRLVTGHGDDLGNGISLLTQIMISGSRVPVVYWREIIRRLGMLGRLDDLARLSFFLADWYASDKFSLPLRLELEPRSNPRPSKLMFRCINQLPSQVPSSHSLHPLRLLFPAALQKAIVEWGFICALKTSSKRTPFWNLLSPDVPSIMSGLKILRSLHELGVYIDFRAVRSAIFHRLMVYYGPGRSKSLRNRSIRAKNVLGLEEMIARINQVLGRKVFYRTDMWDTIQSSGKRRIRRTSRHDMARVEKSKLSAF